MEIIFAMMPESTLTKVKWNAIFEGTVRAITIINRRDISTELTRKLAPVLEDCKTIEADPLN